MSEYHDAFIDSGEDGPITQLADVLRGFALNAIEEQSLRDAERDIRGGTKPQPGTLYKTDGGWLKVCLEAPTNDVVFHGRSQLEPGRESQQLQERLPSVWILIPLGKL